jgi:hypothetical protein
VTVPTAAERPTVSVREGAPWFGVSPATFYRAAAEGRAPCDVLKVGARVSIVTASARRVLGLDPPATNGSGSVRDEGPAPDVPALVRNDSRGQSSRVRPPA